MKLACSLALLAVFIFSTGIFAQTEAAMRPSPAASAKAVLANDANVQINYSSPAVKGRKIWDGLVPYGQVWRTGANEATVFQSDKDLLINGYSLPAGKYAVFTIPNEKEWTFIFNKDWDQWGAFSYDASRDVLRIPVSPQHSPQFNERMTFTISDNTLTLYWEHKRIDLRLQ